MAEDITTPPVNRRDFIRAAALSAVVATSAGASAALLVEKNARINLPPAAPAVQLPVIENAQNSAELISRMMASQVENARLRAQLNAAQDRLEIAEMRASGREDDIASAIQSQLEESRGQNSKLTEEVSVLAGLVALYQELENVDLESTISDGLSALDESLNDLLLQIPLVTEGVAVGQQALSDLEAKLPVLESASQWLEDQFEDLGGHIDDLELALLGAVKATGPLLVLLADWFSGILKWLPFGIGDKSSSAMEGLSQLVADVLQTKDEVDTQVIKPIHSLIQRENNETALHRDAINPLREKLIDPTTQAVEKTSIVEERFQSYLVNPINQALEERKRISGLIVEYQAEQKI